MGGLGETNSKKPLKFDGWNTLFSSLGFGLCSKAFAVSFREGIPTQSKMDGDLHDLASKNGDLLVVML